MQAFGPILPKHWLSRPLFRQQSMLYRCIVQRLAPSQLLHCPSILRCDTVEQLQRNGSLRLQYIVEGPFAFDILGCPYHIALQRFHSMLAQALQDSTHLSTTVPSPQ